MTLLHDVGDGAERLASALRGDVQTCAPADQPVHTLYWPADRFSASTVHDAGASALELFDRHLGTPSALAALALVEASGGSFNETLWARTRARLGTQPVEDIRIDFEDGYGIRADATEDAHADAAGRAVVEAIGRGAMCPRVGIRVKALTPDLVARSARTLERFTAALAEANTWPELFVVTLPKVTHAEQARLGDALLGALERRHGREAGSIRLEVMVETTESLIGADGRSPLPGIVDAGVPRLLGVHLGVYDFTASLFLPPSEQAPDHKFCQLARGLTRLAVGGRVHVSDGASNVLPVGSADAVHNAWRVGYDQVEAALREGYVQGWDMHPGQLVVRHAANVAFWLRSHNAAAPRLRALLETAVAAAGATTVEGEVIDEPATGRALLRAVQRAFRVGATDESQLEAAGMSLADVNAASFPELVVTRQQAAEASSRR